jgi:Interferon-induced transmembrane protein
MPDDRYSDDAPESRRYEDEPDGPRYDDRDYRRGGAPDIPNYLVQSVLVTMCCCLPFGIVAIVNAAKVNSLVQAGDYAAAQQASDDAKKWSTIGFVCGLIGNGLVFALQIMSVGAGRH